MDSMRGTICPAVARHLDPLHSRKLACTFRTCFFDNTQIRNIFLFSLQWLRVVAAPRCAVLPHRTRGHRVNPHVPWTVHDLLEHSEPDQKYKE